MKASQKLKGTDKDTTTTPENLGNDARGVGANWMNTVELEWEWEWEWVYGTWGRYRLPCPRYHKRPRFMSMSLSMSMSIAEENKF